MIRRISTLLFLFSCALSAFGQGRAGPFNLNATTGANSCAVINVSPSVSSTVAIQVGGTFSATLQPEVIIAGQAAANTQTTPSTSNTPQATITAAGVYTTGVAGVDKFQVCVTTYASGTVVVYLNVSTGVAGGGTGGGGV